MLDLELHQYIFVSLIFIWSGFVRTGIGFGGAIMSLPFLLLVDNRPIIYLPIIAIHLLFFATLALLQNNRHNFSKSGKLIQTVDWRYLKKSMSIMIVPKLIGVFGLLTLPNNIMSAIIFCIVFFYSLTYILNKPFKSNNRFIDGFFLMMGGYISGTSLIGAPLIVAVTAEKVEKSRLRDTLFAIWIILVSIKVAVFIYSGVDLQLINHLWLLPCSGLGHFLGLKLHKHLQQSDTVKFFRVIGVTLFIMSLIGLSQIIF